MKVLHLSFNKAIEMPMVTRQPDGDGVSTENLKDRICFSPTILQCFLAIYPDIKHYFEDPKHDCPFMDMYAYGTESELYSQVSVREMKTNIADYHVTGEVAFNVPVTAKLVGKVRFYNPRLDKEVGEVHAYPFDNPALKMLNFGPRVKYDIVKHLDLSYDLKKGDFYGTKNQ